MTRITDEELVRALRKVGTTNGHDNSVILRAADRLSALSPRVKELEWSVERRSGFNIHVGRGLGLKYEAAIKAYNPGWIVTLGENDVVFDSTDADEDEAKAAAQADYEVRILSAIEVSPSPRVVTDEMAREFDKAYRKASNGIAWFQVGSNHTEAVRAALTAALSSAGEKDERGVPIYPLMACGECGKPVRPADETIIGEAPMHRVCADIWVNRNADAIAGSPRPTSADKLEVVAWQDGEYLTTDPACANGCIPLTDHAIATRIITEQAEKIAEQARINSEWWDTYHALHRRYMSMMGKMNDRATKSSDQISSEERQRYRDHLGSAIERAAAAEARNAELVKALNQIATGSISGEPGNYRDTVGIMRDIAREALGGNDGR